MIVRPLAPGDRDGWGRLWTGYLDFYGTARPDSHFDAYFARLLSDDPHDFHGLVAEDGGRLVGLAHYLFHAHGWQEARVCYLQDLYADPTARGRGVGRALVEAVYRAADAEGAPKVYWLTQEFNAAGRRLYDRVGRLTPFIRYDRP